MEPTLTEKQFFKKLIPIQHLSTAKLPRLRCNDIACTGCPFDDCPVLQQTIVHHDDINNYVNKKEQEFKDTQAKLKFLNNL